MTTDPNCSTQKTPLAPLKTVQNLLSNNPSGNFADLVFWNGFQNPDYEEKLIAQLYRNCKTFIRFKDLCTASNNSTTRDEKFGELVKACISNAQAKTDRKHLFIDRLTQELKKEIPFKESVDQFLIDYVTNITLYGYRYLSTNFLIHVFNQFCLSILKAEYIFDANQTEKILKPLSASLTDAIIGTEKEFWPWTPLDKNPQNDIEILTMLCESCFILDRKIDAILNPNDTQQFVNVADNNLYIKRYDHFNRYYINRNDAEKLPEIIRLFPYLFQTITDMTVIDHCFSVGIQEMSTLLSVEDALRKTIDSCENFKDLCRAKTTKDELRDLFDLEVVDQLLDTLQLLDRKNKFLIYKVLSSDTSKLLSNFDFMVNNEICSLHHKIADYKAACQQCIPYVMFDDFVASIVQHNKLPQSDRRYENLLFAIIANNEEPEYLDRDYKRLAAEYLDQYNRHAAGLDDEEYRDIKAYDQKILKRVQEQFIHYGRYLKKLQIVVDKADFSRSEGRQLIEDHLSEIEGVLSETGTRILSCSFLTRHFEWCLGIIHKVVETKQHAKLGFDLVNRINTLSLELKRLVHAIEDNCDAANYGSLFEDCFYRCESDSEGNHAIARLKIGSEGIDSVETLRDYVYGHRDVVFIASTFLRPIGKTKLRETYSRLNFRRKNIVNQFYLRFVDSIKSQIDTEFNQRLEKSQETIDRKLDGNRRSVTQILGIFAAFIALASTSISGSTMFKEGSNYIRFIVSMTLCLSVFVVLLQFVAGTGQRNPRQGLLRYAGVFLVMLLLVILLLRI